MRIACLAWGSLVWKWAPLEPVDGWFDDGPWLPIEFAREADQGELATALTPGAADVWTLWTELATGDLDVAREQLRRREGIPLDRPTGVGQVPEPLEPGPWDRRIADWAATKALDAVVWTALPPRSNGVEGRIPSADEAVAYLAALRGDARAHAEDYVRRVPPALSTAYRSLFAERLGWTPRDG